ncbi:MAG: hypothetical protein AB1638_08955 [Nitrospirota bacterium]
MSIKSGFLFLIGLILFWALPSFAGVDVNESEKLRITSHIAKLGIPFVTNEGQTDEKVRFYARIFGGTVFITKDGETVYSLLKIEDEKTTKRLALREEFIGGSIGDPVGEEESITKVSYLMGNDPSKWKADIPSYALVNLGEVYRGIEVKLRAHGNNVEKLFYIKPGANSKDIKVRQQFTVKASQTIYYP